MQQSQVFISYRRDDTAGHARAVYDEPARHFGPERLFIDVDAIGACQAFDEVIAHAVGGSKVLLLMIGKRWLGEREGQPARITEAGDFAPMEVAAALAQRMRVIPMLLDGAAMPATAELPEALQPLVRRSALAIDNTCFAANMERLVSSSAGSSPAPSPARSRVALAAGVAGGLLPAGMVAWWWPRHAPPQADGSAATGSNSTSAGAATARSARPDANGEWRTDVTCDWPNAHRHHGRLQGDEIRFVTQTEGGDTPHVPIEFVARRVTSGGSTINR